MHGDPDCKSHVMMEVFKDCTGSYLRVPGSEPGNHTQEFKVCNSAILKNHNTGESVNACYTKINECEFSDDEVVCYMLHEHDGFIKVRDIK